MFVPLCCLCTSGTEKRMFQSCLLCYRAGRTDAPSFEIDTEETPGGKAVKPFMFAHCAGIVVGAHRADARTAVPCHEPGLFEWRQCPDFL